MEKQFTFLGEDLHKSNPHWLEVYGKLLIAISKIKIEDTTHLLAYPINEKEAQEYKFYIAGQSAVCDLLEDNGLYIEGYTLDQVSEWFLWFIQDWHSRNKEVQIQAKKDKIQKLKKELNDLEGELFPNQEN